MPDQEKIIDKIKKLMSLAESEEAIGNTGASENISAKAQELLMKYHLSHADIKLVQETEPDFIPPIMGKSIVPNPFIRVNATKKVRIFWFEELAKVVAEGYFCKARVEQGDVWFYGLDMDREIAIYMFQSIADRANKVHDQEFNKLKKVVGAARINIGGKKDVEPLPKVWEGDKEFTDSFHKGFRESLKQAFIDNINGDNETYEKAMREVDDYMFSTPYDTSYGYPYRSSTYIQEPAPELAHWLYVINIGKKYGSRVSKKVNSIAQQSTQEQLVIAEKKGFVGEVYLVLDNSASMQEGDKLPQLKDGAKSFVAEATEKGQAVGVIKFGEVATHLISPQLELNKGITSIINSISGNEGSTMMIPALRLAHQYFRNTRVKKTILLVTDGSPTDYEGREKVIEVANEIKRTGIEILTIGCGSANSDFLKRLATDATRGELVADNDLKNGMKRMAGLLTA